MKQSDAMALSIIVGIPDLAHIDMEPKETDSTNIYASRLTYSPQKQKAASPTSSQIDLKKAYDAMD